MKTSINFKEACFPDFSSGETRSVKNEEDYTSLLMNVPLTVRVEIGKAKLKMREVLNLAQGSIICLEKQAGAPVEVVANDCVVARGDVIVIDDNFGVRITEIISSKKFVKDLENQAEKDSGFSETVPPAASAASAEKVSVFEETAEYEEAEEEISQEENEE